jgi:hypothetical protein
MASEPVQGEILDGNNNLVCAGDIVLDEHGRSGLLFPEDAASFLPELLLKTATTLSLNGRRLPIRNLQPRPERLLRQPRPHYDFDIDFGV